MAKKTLCKWKEETCTEERVKYPGKSILSPFCLYHLRCHQAISHVYKKRIEIANDKAELEKARETKKTGLNVNRFYNTSAWLNFSHFVLLFYANEDLEVACSTDPTLWYKITDGNICVGHFIKVFDGNSTNFATAFEFCNVGPQSRKENDHGGNMEQMAIWIEETHGAGTVDRLKAMKRHAFKLDKYTLNEISKKYLGLLNDELRRRNIDKNPWRK